MSSTNNASKKIILIIGIPWCLSELIAYFPELSYTVAWTGSFFIFYLSLLSPLKHQSHDIPLSQQVMRPIVLIQLIFAGFMCCTSIFYFIQNYSANLDLHLIAKCQRLSLLAHTALVSGMIILIRHHPAKKFELNIPLKKLLIFLVGGAYLVQAGSSLISGLEQMRQPMLNISLSSGISLLFLSIPGKDKPAMLLGCIVFGIHLWYALLSGFKETVILNVIQALVFAYPMYKRAVLICGLPLIASLLYLLPTFTAVFRMQAWVEKKNKEQAGAKAYQALFATDNKQEIASNNWEFLTNRFSEIGMFSTYVSQVPEYIPYSGLNILKDAAYALIPRIIWPDKPSTETIAMERVYQAGIANRSSTVSAKTRPVVDAYLMGGYFSIAISMFIYGIITQLICNTAELRFGGYQIGCAVIFNSLFQSLWRGNTLEFLLNNILYGYLLMLLIHWIFLTFKIIKPISSHENHTHYTFL